MFVSLSTIVIVLTLVFGGSGATVLAAKNSVPEQSLYFLKLMTEDLRLKMRDPARRVEMALIRVENRVSEVLRMHEQGKENPESLMIRLQNQLEETLRLAAYLENGEMIQALEQVRERLKTQGSLLRARQVCCRIQAMTGNGPIRVVLVDDHAQMHRVVQAILGVTSDIKLVGQGANGEEGIALCEQHRPDIALMDVVMPVMDGIEATKILHQRLPAIKILVLSSFQDHESVYAMLHNGAVGYLTKGSLAQDLAETIRATFQGKMVFSGEVGAQLVASPQPAVDFHLTDRELEVLVHLAEGLTNQQTAQKLSISQSTLKFHMTNIFQKLGVQTRSEALVLAAKNNLI